MFELRSPIILILSVRWKLYIGAFRTCTRIELLFECCNEGKHAAFHLLTVETLQYLRYCARTDLNRNRFSNWPADAYSQGYSARVYRKQGSSGKRKGGLPYDDCGQTPKSAGSKKCLRFHATNNTRSRKIAGEKQSKGGKAGRQNSASSRVGGDMPKWDFGSASPTGGFIGDQAFFAVQEKHLLEPLQSFRADVIDG